MRRIIVTLLALSIVSGMGHAAAAQTVKLGTLAPEGSSWHRIIRDLAEQWRALSNGALDVRIYAGGIAGDEPDMVRKMKIGQLHAAALTGAGLSRIAPEIQALQLPMMLRSDAELDYVRERIGPEIEAALEAKGFKVLTWGDAGWVHFFAQAPVVHPDDLKPQRLFVWSAETAYIELWKDFGFEPVPLAATDIHTALQSGLINAFSTTPIAALSFQWFGLAKNMTDLKWAPLVGALVTSTRTWEAVPEDLKPALLRASREAGVRLQREVRKLDSEAVRVMQEHGLVVHHVPPEIALEWERIVRAGYAKLADVLVPASMIAEVERLRNAYRAEHGER